MGLAEISGMPEPERFLRDYWQQQPVLIRQAFADFRCPISMDEVAGLALEESVESRLIRGSDKVGWDLAHGPFDEATLTGLPERDWTLLVQDVDKLLPELAPVLDRFTFLPRWRLDDLMISIAADGGSVGAHRDRYDVFLLQAEGRRRWLIDSQPNSDLEDETGGPLRLLRDFRTSDDLLLEPGDMLYLPPGIPHHGIADGNCQTWSIGFRGPKPADLLAELFQCLVERCPDQVLGDHLQQPAPGTVDLDPASLTALRNTLRATMQADDALLDHCIAAALGAPRGGRDSALDDVAAIPDPLPPNAQLERNPATRFLRLPEVRDLLYVNGEAWTVDPACRALIDTLTVQRRLQVSDLHLERHGEPGRKLLTRLLEGGHWWILDD